jgi:hypothetical protein
MQNESLLESKNRPVYHPVVINEHSLCHIFISEKDVHSGGVLEDSLSKEMNDLYDACSDEQKQRYVLSDAKNVDTELREPLSSIPLSSTVYIDGTEPFIWKVFNSLISIGLVDEQIKMIKPKGNQRDVFCVHCYTITHGVTKTPAICSHCQRPLLVSDHFSKRHSAYMGYQVNAEALTDMPKTQELS